MDGPHELSDELLRPALEFAVLVAGMANRAKPPLVFLPGLKPYLRFQKLPAKALGEVRKALEADDGFRARLGEAVGDEDIGVLAHLWLTRPEGWEEEASRLATEQLAAQERVAADKQERSAMKRAEAAEASAARARADLVIVRADVTGERQKRQAAEAKVGELTARAGALSADIDRLRGEARAATDQALAARRELETTRERLVELQGAHAALAARLDDTLAERAQLLAATPSVESGVDSAGVTAAAGGLRDVAAAMTQLATSLSETAAALGAGARTTAPPRTGTAATTRKRTRPGRAALATPGGLLGNQPEVVTHFLRTAGVVFVIDGYNVAKTAWPDEDVASQRERLLDALDDVVRRAGTWMHVVFDGADVAAATGRRLLNVRFSPVGVIADDVIRQLVAELPEETPVVVVTSDRAIVNDVRAMGANTLGSAQFISVLGR